MPAKGTAEWKGDVPSGTGTFTAGDTISGGYTFKSRFEDGPGSNPEQLIAAAHAACFSMALSNILAQAGHPPDSVQTEATVTLRPVDGAPTITKIALVTVGRVPGTRRGRVRGARLGGQGRLSGEPGAGRSARDHPRGVSGLMSTHRCRLVTPSGSTRPTRGAVASERLWETSRSSNNSTGEVCPPNYTLLVKLCCLASELPVLVQAEPSDCR